MLNMLSGSEEDRVSRVALTLRVVVAEQAPVDAITAKITSMAEAAELARQGKGPKPKTDNTRYHGGDLPDELAALMSLVLGRRVIAGELTREFYPGDDPKGAPVGFTSRFVGPLLSRARQPIVPALIGQRSLDLDLLLSYPTLQARDAILLLRAARSYQDATWGAEADPETAWVLLVSAIETAANQWWPYREATKDLSSAQVLELSKPELTNLLRSHDESGTLLEGVAQHISYLLQSRQKFLQFLEQFSPPAPQPRPPEHLSLSWNQKGFRKALDQVYTNRSNALHSGLPFPPAMSEAPFPCDGPEGAGEPIAEIPWKSMSYSKGGFWTGAESPMLLNTFAYIVRGALLGWWNWLATRAQQS
ncbi:MAG: hypothetical protein ACJ796_02070 [Gemmatimonadaceae bacterium]